MMMPIIEKMFSVVRNISSASSTPISDSGNDSMIAIGCRKLLELAGQDHVDEDHGQRQRPDHVAEGSTMFFVEPPNS